MTDGTRKTEMTGADVPVSITRHIYTMSGAVVSQNEAADIVAHLWHGIREHFITAIVADLEELGSDPATPDHYRPGIRKASNRVRAAVDGGY
jgi:hypothetical protein